MDRNVELNTPPPSLDFATLPTTGLGGVKGTSLRSEARYTLKSKVLLV